MGLGNKIGNLGKKPELEISKKSKLNLFNSKSYQESVETSVKILDELEQLDRINKLEQLDDKLMKMYSDLKKEGVFNGTYEEFKKIYLNKEKKITGKDSELELLGGKKGYSSKLHKLLDNNMITETNIIFLKKYGLSEKDIVNNLKDFLKFDSLIKEGKLNRTDYNSVLENCIKDGKINISKVRNIVKQLIK